MAEYDKMMTDFLKVFETVRIPFLLTDSDLVLRYANRFARQVLPLRLERDEKLDIQGFLQREDSVAFERMVSDCRSKGEGGSILKQRGIDKYFKVRVYEVKNSDGELIFHFEDISQSRILENQLYEHLVDLYGQLESQARELSDLKAILIRSRTD